MESKTQINGWQDFVELLIVCWMVSSPFVLGFFGETNASLTIIGIGCVCLLFAILGLATENPVDEWINMFLGALLIASPFLFSYSTLVVPMINAMVCGGLIITMTILALTHEYHEMRLQQQNQPQ